MSLMQHIVWLGVALRMSMMMGMRHLAESKEVDWLRFSAAAFLCVHGKMAALR